MEKENPEARGGKQETSQNTFLAAKQENFHNDRGTGEFHFFLPEESRFPSHLGSFHRFFLFPLSKRGKFDREEMRKRKKDSPFHDLIKGESILTDGNLVTLTVPTDFLSIPVEPPSILLIPVSFRDATFFHINYARTNFDV